MRVKRGQDVSGGLGVGIVCEVGYGWVEGGVVGGCGVDSGGLWRVWGPGVVLWVLEGYVMLGGCGGGV